MAETTGVASSSGGVGFHYPITLCVAYSWGSAVWDSDCYKILGGGVVVALRAGAARGGAAGASEDVGGRARRELAEDRWLCRGE